MNLWTCDHRGCDVKAVGMGGAVGLRAIGWYFRTGPVTFCPLHRPDPVTCHQEGSEREGPCELCAAEDEAKQWQLLMKQRLGTFEEYLARVEEMLADPERTDPARLARADQVLPQMRRHWDALIEISRPLLHGGMQPVEFVDFIMTAAAGTNLPPEQISALLAVGLLRSYETARLGRSS